MFFVKIAKLHGMNKGFFFFFQDYTVALLNQVKVSCT